MLDNILNNKDVFIFDLDGTLIDSVGIWNKVDQKLISDLGNIFVDEDTININRDKVLGSSTSGAPYEDYMLYLQEKYRLNKSLEEIYSYRRSIMNEFLINDVKKKPYAQELIELLKELGMTLVLATTTTRRNLNTYTFDNEDTKSLNFMDNFSLILTMEDVVLFKPNPEIFNKVLETLHLDKERCVIIEDSIVGIKAANEIGIDSIAVKEEHSNTTTDELHKCANLYIDSLEEIYEFYREKLVKKAKKD